MPSFRVTFSWVAIAAVLLPEFAQGGSYAFISSVADPGYLTIGGHTYEGGPHVLRYQFVTVDTEYLRRYLDKVAVPATLESSEPLTLNVFPDVEIIAFPIRASASSATLEIRSYTGETEFHVIGNVALRVGKKGHFQATIQLENQSYGIGPTDQLPYHVAVEADPENLPPID